MKEGKDRSNNAKNIKNRGRSSSRRVVTSSNQSTYKTRPLSTLWQLFATLQGPNSSVRSCVHPPARGIIKIQIETRAIARENPAPSHETKSTDPS